MKKVVAIHDGFYGGVRIREGATFVVSDTAKGKWFVPYDEFKNPAPKLPPVETSLTKRPKPGSFVDMVTRKPTAAPAATMSELNLSQLADTDTVI